MFCRPSAPSSRAGASNSERMGIDVRLQGMVEDVDESGVTVKYRDGSTQHIATRCVLWAVESRLRRWAGSSPSNPGPGSIGPGACRCALT